MTNTYGTGTTVYYRGTATSGAVTLTTTSTDAQSGMATYNFPSLGSGWTSTPGTAGVTTYTWSAASPAAPGVPNITATNNAGSTSGTRAVTFTADNTTPTGGAIAYTGGRTTSTTASLTLTLGSDAGSGLVTTKVIQAATAPVTGGVCGTFGAFAQVACVNGSGAIDTNTAAAQFTTPIIQHALQIGGPRGVVHPSLLRPHTSQGDGTDTLRFTSPRRGRREAMAAAGG